MTRTITALSCLLYFTSSIAYTPQHSQNPHSPRSIAERDATTGISCPPTQPVQIARRADQHGAPNYTFEELYCMQKAFLDAFIYPANQKEAEKINSTIFSEDVQGRVDITRTFEGRELNTEYIFGLFSNLASGGKDAFTLLGFATEYKILHFAASQNIASASTLFQFKFPVLPTPIPLVIDTWNVFNERGEISMYDATFKWWDWAVDSMFAAIAKQMNKKPEEVVAFATQKLASSICKTAIDSCKGTDVQYKSTEECEDFLGTKVAFGKPYELGRNTLLCRMVHQNMVPSRPSVHCPHIGPSGGGYCNDDKDYATTVTNQYFQNFPFAYSDIGAL